MALSTDIITGAAEIRRRDGGLLTRSNFCSSINSTQDAAKSRLSLFHTPCDPHKIKRQQGFAVRPRRRTPTPSTSCAPPGTTTPSSSRTAGNKWRLAGTARGRCNGWPQICLGVSHLPCLLIPCPPPSPPPHPGPRRDKTHAARHYEDDVPQDVKDRRLQEVGRHAQRRWGAGPSTPSILPPFAPLILHRRLHTLTPTRSPPITPTRTQGL
jgi:hypothetical protein